MTYHVLARKWRPQVFNQVVGQKHVLLALTNSLSMGRIHHAYLLSGTRGVGKTSIARLLAKCFNCETGLTSSPCGRCGNCISIETGSFIDLIEIDAASRTKVEDTRDLLDNIQYSSACGRFKIYLIDEVHMLSKHSFNALLKTLEEPPVHVKFILVTTDPQKLPNTIISRCLHFHLRELEITQIKKQLAHILKLEKINYDSYALYLLARAAEGSMRDALTLTDKAIYVGQGNVMSDNVEFMLGMPNSERPLAILEAIIKGDGSTIMTLMNELSLCSIDWDGLLVELLRLIHGVAMTQFLPSYLNNHSEFKYPSRLSKIAQKLSPDDIQVYYQILLMGRKDLSLAPSRRMGIEITMLRALAFCLQNKFDESKCI